MAIRSGLGHYATSAPVEAAPEDTRQRDAARRADASGALSANPYSNPTDYRNWSQVYGANAGVANRTASGLAGAVAGQTADARAARQSSYGDFQQGVSEGARSGVVRKPDGSYDLANSYAPSVYGGAGAPGYDGPTGYGNEYAYNASQGAQTAAGRLGTTAGVQGQMGPGTSMFGAQVARTAGASQFGARQRDAAASGREYDAAVARAPGEVDTARRNAEGANARARSDYENYLAQLASEYWNRMGGALAADPSSPVQSSRSTRPAPSMYDLQQQQAWVPPDPNPDNEWTYTIPEGERGY